jgi:serine/threonine protein kinase
MQDFFGSIRRSIVFPTPPSHPDNDGRRLTGIANKIGSAIRKSRIGLKSPPPPPPPIRWRKGELIGSGAFGRVYMGMNLDSGELIAVKQVNFISFFFDSLSLLKLLILFLVLVSLGFDRAWFCFQSEYTGKCVCFYQSQSY